MYIYSIYVYTHIHLVKDRKEAWNEENNLLKIWLLLNLYLDYSVICIRKKLYVAIIVIDKNTYFYTY